MGNTDYNKKSTQQDLTNKMSELNDILNNSWDGIGIIDATGNILFSNKAFEPILNYTKDELLKLNFLNLVDTSSRDTMKFALIKARKLKRLNNVNIICRRKDKQKVYLKCSLVLMGNHKYFVLNANDHTEQIAKNEIINQYVLSYQLDSDGNIVDVSNAFSKFVKYKKDELIGQPYSLIFHREFGKLEFYRLEKSIEKDFQWQGTLKLIDKIGNISFVETKVKPTFNKYGDILGYIFIGFDITNKYEILNLEDGNYVLIDGNDNKDETITKQSYFEEVNNIIQTIASAWMEPLKDIDEHINDIKESNFDKNVVKNKLNDISEMTKILSKNITSLKSTFINKSDKKIVNIKHSIESLINMLENTNVKNQVKIQRDLHDVPQIKIYEDKLRDVILSIITNSLEAFNRNKTLEPIIDISLNIQEGEDKILLQIIDNAGGISDDILEHIFDPYLTIKKEKGKGMGLYTAKTIIESQLDGTIEIDNDKDMTVVSMLLPRGRNS